MPNCVKYYIDIGSEQSHLTLNERHKNKSPLNAHREYEPLQSFWNSRRKSFFNFGNIIMNGEFPSGISAATDSMLAYICIHINITSTRMRFRLCCSRKRSYLNPLNTPFHHSLVRSFVRSLGRLARSYCYTLEASFSPRKESVHNVVQTFQTLSFWSCLVRFI